MLGHIQSRCEHYKVGVVAGGALTSEGPRAGVWAGTRLDKLLEVGAYAEPLRTCDVMELLAPLCVGVPTRQRRSRRDSELSMGSKSSESLRSASSQDEWKPTMGSGNVSAGASKVAKTPTLPT